METDYQLYQLFNDVNATTAYLTTLLSFISDRYESQASTILTFPYLQIYSNSNDPWSTPENGGNSIDMLNEFVGAWQGNVPAGATLGHMMSGAGLGGGVAYLDVLCNNQLQLRRQRQHRGAGELPRRAAALQLGLHRGGPRDRPQLQLAPHPRLLPAPRRVRAQRLLRELPDLPGLLEHGHDHELLPPVQRRHREHHHLLPPRGGGAPHERVGGNCNPAIFEVQVTAPEVVSDLSPTQTMIQAVVGSIGSATMNYRVTGSSTPTQVPMTPMGSGIFVADIPAVQCGLTVEYWFDIDIAGVGAPRRPPPAPRTRSTPRSAASRPCSSRTTSRPTRAGPRPTSAPAPATGSAASP